MVIHGDFKTEPAEKIFEVIFGLIFWLSISVWCIWFGDELGEGMVGAQFGLVSSKSLG
jgi:hypothetical protein